MTLSTERPTIESALVVATADGLLLPNRVEPVLPGRHIGDVAAVDGTVWALVDSTELHRVDTEGPPALVTSLAHGSAGCVHVHHGTVMVGGDDAGLWRLRDDALEPVESFRDAPTRADWSTPWGGPPSVLSMASQRDDLYVGVHVGGILRSADGAATWADTIDLRVDVHDVVADSDGTIWAATGEHALARSTDRGATWQYHADGLDGTYSLAVARTEAGVLTGTSSGHAARDGAVLLFDGTRFRRVEGLPDDLGGQVGPRQIAGRGKLAALVAPGGAVYVSEDGGRRWRRMAHLAGATAIVLVSSRS